MNVVEIENVTKTFGSVTAVDELTLNVPKGCIYGFIGPNGSGKTTTLRMIMNIFYPDSGTIRTFGEEMKGTSTDRIGYLPEERGMYKKMKVRELLKFYGELKSGHRVDKDVDYWLERLELSDWANKKIETGRTLYGFGPGQCGSDQRCCSGPPVRWVHSDLQHP